MVRHYIRVDADGYIIFYDNTVGRSEEEMKDWILLEENGQERTSILGEVEPLLNDENGCFSYKYDNGLVREATPEEINQQLERKQTIGVPTRDERLQAVEDAILFLTLGGM